MPQQIMGKCDISLLPHPLLRGDISHYRVALPAASRRFSEQITIVPDASGCLVLSAFPNRLVCAFWGPMTRAVPVCNDFANTPRLFVEFLPGGLHRLTGVDASALTDVRAPLGLLDAAMEREIGELFETCGEPLLFFGGLDRLFLRRLSAVRADEPGLALARLLRDGPIRSRRELAEQTHYSERHLDRLLRPSLGLTAKGFSRIRRINRAVLAIQRGALPLTELAQQMGYYDQAHFGHDFKAVCGVSPGEYRRIMSGFYNERLKFSSILDTIGE
nr:helix-turn-helix transcriptional regulator [Feifania hominis]